MIDNFVRNQARLQTVTSFSGSLYSGSGLGEPKFHVDETKFTGAWGRPQRDGAALRAIALMDYAAWLLESGGVSKVQNILWPIVSSALKFREALLLILSRSPNYLNYIGQYWNKTGFDLWEEVPGSSFFTLQASYRSLVQGSHLAERLGLGCRGCLPQASEILCFLQSFWDGTVVTANINTDVVRSGVDVNVLLGALVAFDAEATCDGELLQPCSPMVLASHKALVDASRRIYAINRGIRMNEAAHIGRYPEDVYQGGNPWYLATFAATEILYAAAAQWRAQGRVNIDDTSYPFFALLYPAVEKRNYTACDTGSKFAAIVDAVMGYADDFLVKAFKHIPSAGDLSEQYSRTDGSQISALNLTWSYAAFLSVTSRRSGSMPRSWGLKNGPTAPPVCAASSFNGTYEAAVAAGTSSRGSLCTISVDFRVLAATYWGENLLLYGNSTELGAWEVSEAWPLGAESYNQERPLWQLRIELPADETLAYKYVRKGSGGELVPESQERTLRVNGCGSKLLVVNDHWQY